MKWLPPEKAPLSILGRLIYPLGKIMLLSITLGRYPPENKPHNALFVALFPWWAFVIIAVIIYG